MDSSTAFRPGSQLDKIAEKLKIDPADCGSASWNLQTPWTAILSPGTVNLAECIRRIVKVSGWKEKFPQTS